MLSDRTGLKNADIFKNEVKDAAGCPTVKTWHACDQQQPVQAKHQSRVAGSDNSVL